MENKMSGERKIGIAVVLAFLAGFGALGYNHILESQPAWMRYPDEQASSQAYDAAAEGQKDSRYGYKTDFDGEVITGDCPAVIPDIRKALADGKLTNLEAHNLNLEATQLQDEHDFTESKNKALELDGKADLPVVDCPRGHDLFTGL